MPHDPLLEAQLTAALNDHGIEPEVKKMFGGLAFMVRGHMTVGITNKGDLMVRFDPKRHTEIAVWPGAKPMTFGKGGMKGFLFVEAEAATRTLAPWIDLALAYNGTLPPKTPAAPGAGRQPRTKRTPRTRS